MIVSVDFGVLLPHDDRPLADVPADRAGRALLSSFGREASVYIYVGSDVPAGFARPWLVREGISQWSLIFERDPGFTSGDEWMVAEMSKLIADNSQPELYISNDPDLVKAVSDLGINCMLFVRGEMPNTIDTAFRAWDDLAATMKTRRARRGAATALGQETWS